MSVITPVVLKPRQDIVSLLQMTDPHLGTIEGQGLLGMNTDLSLQTVLDLSRQFDADALLATGDLANFGSRAAYKRLVTLLNSRQLPDFWLVGNHDDSEEMAAVVGKRSRQLSCCIHIGNWQVLMLDSSKPQEVAGRLGTEQLAILEHCLSRYPLRHTLVCLHHHPVSIGSTWLDGQILEDAADFFAVLSRHASVRAVLWGHIHQEYQVVREGVLLLASPSTCVQFKPGSPDFALDDKAPGYRWLKLHPHGQIETGVERVTGIEFDYNKNSIGY